MLGAILGERLCGGGRGGARGGGAGGPSVANRDRGRCGCEMLCGGHCTARVFKFDGFSDAMLTWLLVETSGQPERPEYLES